MAQIIEQGNLAAALGNKFGEGLSQQIPKELERYRLSQSLKGLQKNAANMNPFEQAAYLYSSPGVTPEIATQLIPLLQLVNARNENLKFAQGAGQGGQGGQGAAPMGQPGQIGQNLPRGTFGGAEEAPQDPNALRKIVTPETTRTLQERLGVPKSQPELLQDAARLQMNRPAYYATKDPQQSYMDAVEADNRRVAQEKTELEKAQRQQAVQTRLNEEFERAFDTELQKKGQTTYADISGEMRNRFLERAEDDVARGKLTEREAALKYGRQALDFAKKKNNLFRIASTGFYNQSPSQAQSELKELRKEYERLGGLEEFKNDLIKTQGISPHFAYSLAFPVSENKALSSYINKIKAGTSIDKIVTDIAPLITDKDSPQAIARQIQKRGLDYQSPQTLQAFRRNPNIRLNDRQRTEISEPVQRVPTLNDVWFFSFTDPDQLEDLE